MLFSLGIWRNTRKNLQELYVALLIALCVLELISLGSEGGKHNVVIVHLPIEPHFQMQTQGWACGEQNIYINITA